MAESLWPDRASELAGCRMEWFTSTELMGVTGLPKTDRQIRNIIKEMSSREPEKVRQRAGSKASEVHISVNADRKLIHSG